jgi:hypothetical protein
LVYQIEAVGFQDDEGVVAGYAGIGDDKVFVDFSAYAERGAVQNYVVLFVSLHHDQCGEDAGAGALRRHNGI